MPCLSDDDFAAYLAGELSAEQRARCDAHLAECFDCEEDLHDLRGAEGPGPLTTEAGPELCGRYVVGEQLGAGGMGIVLKAYDPKLGRDIALKVLHTLAADDRRLLREAQALAKLSHPNVVTVFDVGELDGRVFLAMELIAGPTLRAWSRDGQSWSSVLRLLVQAGQGLAAAHAMGLVHRDFKPDNVMVDEHGRARVIDFGLVRGRDDDPRDDWEAPASSSRSSGSATLDHRLTRTGAMVGTPRYMATELLSGRGGDAARPADARSDQFSFCVTTFEMLYGRPPFAGDSLPEIADAAGHQRVEPAPAGSAVPRRVHQILARGLRADPSARWDSMAQLLAELERAARPRRTHWVAAVAALGLGGWWAMSTARDAAAVQRCERAAAVLQPALDGSSRERIGAAFERSPLPYAASTHERTMQTLDAFAEQWSQQRRDGCIATLREELPAPAADRRVRCLEGAAMRFEELVAMLKDADDTVIGEARLAALNLPRLDGCADDVALARLPPPSPGVPEDRAAVRRKLARSQAAVGTGRYVEARQYAASAFAHAQQLDDEQLVGATMAWAGSVGVMTGNIERARPLLEQAHAHGARAGNPVIVAQAAYELVRLSATQGAIEAGQVWLRVAEAAIDRYCEEGDLRRVMGLRAKALLHSSRGQTTEASAAYQRGLALARAYHHRPTIAMLTGQLAQAEARAGNLQAALEHRREALAIYEEELGAEHPETARTRSALASAEMELGDYEASRPRLEAAVASLRSSSPGSNALANSLNELGVWHDRRGEDEQALVYAEEVAELRRSVGGPANRFIAQFNLAQLYLQLGRTDDARATFERARPWATTAERRAWLALALAEVLAKTAEPAVAGEAYAAGVSALEDALGSDSRLLCGPLGMLGRLELKSGRIDAAERVLTSAVQLLERQDLLTDGRYPEIHLDHAEALIVLEERDRAEQALLRADAAIANAPQADRTALQGRAVELRTRLAGA